MKALLYPFNDPVMSKDFDYASYIVDSISSPHTYTSSSSSSSPITDVPSIAPTSFYASPTHSTDPETPHLWHQRLGHVNPHALQTLVKHGKIKGIKVPAHKFNVACKHPCEVCVMAKHNRSPFRPKRERSTTPVEVLHSDICGPYPVYSLGGGKYVLTLLCEATSFCGVAVLKQKSEAPPQIQRMINEWENVTTSKCKTLFTDRGGEYVGMALKQYCASKGIRHEFSIPRTPEQNGKAERLNQTLNNTTRALLFQYDSYTPLWAHAMIYAALIYNCSLCPRVGTTRWEAFYDKIPNVANFRTFGCKVYARVHESQRKKLDPKSQIGIYLGPEVMGSGHKVLIYNPNFKRENKYAVHIVRDVVTFENLTVVTGAQDQSSLHWGGSIPLPKPREVRGRAEPMEALTGEPPLLALPMHPATPMEADDHRGAHSPGLGPRDERTVLTVAEGEVHRGSDPDLGARNERRIVTFDPKPTQPTTPHRHVLPPLPVQLQSVSQPTGPVGVPGSSGISRLAPAFSVQAASSANRICDSHLRSASADNLPASPVQQPDTQDYQQLSHGEVVLTATAFTAVTDFPTPPATSVPSKESVVEGLLGQFGVKESEGPLPVITSVDPKHVPRSVPEAMRSVYAKFWAEAIIDEWLSIIGNDTWVLVEREPWMKVIPCKWIFTIKTDSDGVPTRFKARLVAGGHRQVEGVDYDETFAPVSRHTTLRTMISVAANRSWKCRQVDIKTAFLHGEVDKDVFMAQPSGFNDGKNLVCHLQKTLYGLKQAPRAWYFKLKENLEAIGFKPVSADSSFWVRESVYVSGRESEPPVYIASVVDDMLVTSSCDKTTQRMVDSILERLPGRDLGIAKDFNGFKITWIEATHSAILTQPGHIQELIDKFGELEDMTNGRKLPMKGGLKLCKDGSSEHRNSPPLDVEKFHYRALIGGLNYIACCTRPDITFSVNQLAKFSNLPTEEHWNLAIDVVRYLKGTMHWGISLGHGGVDKAWLKHVQGFADANHGTGLDDKKSISGMLFHVFGGPVSWASKTQDVTATSSCESEFRALSVTSREALWLAKIVNVFGIPHRPFTIKGDNKGALTAIKNHTYTRYTKHIEIHHDFMKDMFQLGRLDFEHIPGKDNPADILTKALEGVKFQQLRYDMGMRCVGDL